MVLRVSNGVAFTVLVSDTLTVGAGIEVTVATRANPGQTAELLHLTRRRRWLDELDGPGGGSFQVHADDPKLADTPDLLAFGNIVRFSLDGVVRQAIRIDARDGPNVAEDETGGRWITVSGVGLRGMGDEAVVYPEYPLHRRSPEERLFTFVADAYTEPAADGWATVVEVQRQGATGGQYSNTFPEGWPDPDAWWIWPGDGNPSVSPGFGYFRERFSLAEGREVDVHATADDAFQLYLNGELILEATEPFDWQKTFTRHLSLDAGDYLLAVRVENYLRPYGDSAAALLCTVMDNATGEVLARSGGATATLPQGGPGWQGTEFPDPAPALTPGEVLALLHAEAVARGVDLDLLSLGFDGSVDSNNAPWAERFDAAIKVGTSYDRVFDHTSATAADVWVAPATRTLHAANRRGVDRSVQTADVAPVILAIAHNQTARRSSSDAELVNNLLTRYRDGWEVRSDAASEADWGRREAYLSLDGAMSTAQVRRSVDAVWARHAQPREGHTITIVAVPGATPYVDFGVGDDVLADTDDGPVQLRVRAIAVFEDEAGNVLYEISVGSMREERERRLVRWLEAVERGTLRGSMAHLPTT